jgi:hypothetical protein
MRAEVRLIQLVASGMARAIVWRALPLANDIVITDGDSFHMVFACGAGWHPARRLEIGAKLGRLAIGPQVASLPHKVMPVTESSR